MTKVPVHFQNTEDIIAFVNMVNSYEEDVDLKSGRQVVDAKSIVSAMALAASGSLEVVIHGSNAEKLARSVSRYA